MVKIIGGEGALGTGNHETLQRRQGQNGHE